MRFPTVSAVVVNYNHFSLLRQCLQSLYHSDLPELEVIVVDNCSPEDGLDEITADFPQAKFLFQKSNLGFSAGCNTGIREARGEYVFLVNNDAMVAPTGWGKLPEYFAADPTIAAVQPKILIDGGQTINNCGLRVQYLGFAWDHHYRQSAHAVQQAEDLAAFSGAAVVLRRDILEQIGAFDENYFMYHEDVDLSFRLRLAGYTIRLQPELMVEHHYSYKRDPQRFYYLERNRWFTVIKTYSWKALVLLGPALLLMEVGMWMFSAQQRWFRKKIASSFAVLLALPRLIGMRKQIKQAAVKHFYQSLMGGIVFPELNHPLLVHVANPFFIWYWWQAKKLLI